MKRPIWRRGARVSLVPFIEADIPKLVKWFNDEETLLFLNGVMPVTEIKEKKWLEKISESYEQPAPRELVLGVMLNDDEKLIGTMGLHNINWINRTAVTGTCIGPKKHRQKGYATEAKFLLLQTAFERLGLFKVYSHVIDFNGDSKKYAGTCGYVEEARLPGEHWRAGKRYDEVVFAVYEDSWRKAYSAWKKDQAKRSSKK